MLASDIPLTADTVLLLRRTRGSGHYQAILKANRHERGAVVCQYPAHATDEDVENFRWFLTSVADDWNIQIDNRFDEPVRPHADQRV